MNEIIDASINSGVRFTDSEWEELPQTENIFINVIEAIINQQFGDIAKESILPRLASYMRMGGVSTQVYGSSVNLGWIAQVVRNLDEYYQSMSAEPSIPSPMEMYNIL